jgi:hypothetical protein
MKIKSFLAKPFASFVHKSIRKAMATAVSDQENILKTLVKVGQNTEFGKQAGLAQVSSYEEYKQAVKIRDYEDLKPSLSRSGKANTIFYGRVCRYTSPKHRVPPAVLNIFPLQKTPFPIILTRPGMRCFVIWPSREIQDLLMAR